MQSIEYYNKLPSKCTCDTIVLLDPMVATGGTACAAIDILTDWIWSCNHPSVKIHLMAVVATEAGIETILSKHPEVEIWVASVDGENVNGEGMIVPGLGDIGHRMFATGTEEGLAGSPIF